MRVVSEKTLNRSGEVIEQLLLGDALGGLAHGDVAAARLACKLVGVVFCLCHAVTSLLLGTSGMGLPCPVG